MIIKILKNSVIIDDIEYVKKEKLEDEKSENLILKKADNNYKTDEEFFYPREHLKTLNKHLKYMLTDVLNYFYTETGDPILSRLAHSIISVSANTNMDCLCDDKFERIYEFQKEKFEEFKKSRMNMNTEIKKWKRTLIGKRHPC